MRVFGLAGCKGSGKTDLMVALTAELTGRGHRVSVMKQAHHGFDIDRPGKDSHRHREAGAAEVMITSARRWALMHELRGDEKPDLDAMLAHMDPVDVLLVTGFEDAAFPRIEVHRPADGKPLLCTDDPEVVALASDGPVAGTDLPVFDLADVGAIADFVCARCGLDGD